MSIPQVHRVPNLKPESHAIVSKALEHIHENAAGITYAQGTATPQAKHVPMGGMHVWDNGAGSKRIYFRTGKDNVGYIDLT
jgi:hypothetical protein